MSDNIKHPAHYAYSKYEPVKVIRSWKLNFNLGNVVKYVARAGRKGDKLEDLEKAKQYLEFEIEAIKGERWEERRNEQVEKIVESMYGVTK